MLSIIHGIKGRDYVLMEIAIGELERKRNVLDTTIIIMIIRYVMRSVVDKYRINCWFGTNRQYDYVWMKIRD